MNASNKPTARPRNGIAELQEFIRRVSANKSKSKQATSRRKLIEKIRPEDMKPSSRQYPWIRFDYDDKNKLHRFAVEVEGLTFGYDDMEQPLLKDFSITVNAGDKIAIIGENGVGKTTLVKLLTNNLEPQSGKIKWAEKATYSTYDQDHEDEFDSDETLTEWVSSYVREGGFEGDDVETLIRGTLGRLFI